MTRARTISLGVLALIFTLLVLHWSGLHGRLAQEITADDSAYFVDALRRLEAFYHGGVANLARGLLQSPPHSPFSTLMALVGFLFLGVHDWAPYVMNAVLVFGLLLFVDYAGRNLSRTVRNILLFVALSVPLSFSAVHEFRPDFAVGLLTAMGVFFGVETAVTAPLNRRRIFFAGLFFGAAFLTKPPFFPHTAILSAVPAVFLGLACLGWSGRPRQGFSQLVIMEACYFAGVLLPPLPHYAWSFRIILNYFLVNTGQGTDAPLWRMEGKSLDVLAHYTVDSAIGSMLGSYFWAFLILCVLGLVLYIRARNRAQALLLVGLLWAVSISLVILVYGRYANPFFGLSYQILLLFGAIRSLGPHPPLGRRGNQLLVAALVAFSVWKVAVQGGSHYARPLLGEPERGARRDLHKIVDVITQAASADFSRKYQRGELIVAFTFWGEVNSSSFDWVALKRGYDFVMSDYHRFGDPEEILRPLADADFVVLCRPGTLGIDGRLPSSPLQGRLIDEFQKKGWGRVIADIPSDGGGYLVLMRENLRTIAFGGAIDGLSAIEGPFPKWNIPPVRWGMYPETTVRVEAPSVQPVEIALQARAAIGQRITILLNDDVIGEYVFASDDFVPIRASGILRPGQNRFIFRYGFSDGSKEDARPRAVLFRAIDLHRH